MILFMRIVLLTLFSIDSNCLYAIESRMVVSTQEQFDAVVVRINNGERMRVLLLQGLYKLRQPLTVTSPLTIKGCTATITCSFGPFIPEEADRSTENHYIFKNENPLSMFSLFYDEKGRLLPLSESVVDSVGVNFIEGQIKAPKIYEVGTQLQIPISSNLMRLKNRTFARAFGYLDTGWGLVNFSLDKADEKYFYCTTLNRCLTKNYMMDNISYKRNVRYVLFNVELNKNAIYYDKKWLFVPKSIKEVYVINQTDSNCSIPKITIKSDVTIRGVRFLGITGITVNASKKTVCEIKNCRFENTIGTTLSIKKVGGKGVKKAVVSDCTFWNCALQKDYVVYLASTYEGVPGIEMKRCLFARYPDDKVIYKNPYGIVRINADAVFENNVVLNTCRNHISCGAGNIFVKGNILYNTDKFNRQVDRNLSSDWGIIYCDHLFTETDKAINNNQHRVILEKNFLYGAFAYGGDARGIFIDDGRGDVKCINNVVLNTQIYSIDSRDVSLQDAASVRNRYEGNIVTSNYRLIAGKAVAGTDIPELKGNIVFDSRENRVSNVRIRKKDRRLNINAKSSCDGDKIKISRELYKVLKKSPGWKNMRRWITV